MMFSIVSRMRRLVIQIFLFYISVKSVSGIFCPNIEPIRYADIHTSVRFPYPVGTVANFTCDAGFKGVGKSSITCLKSGRWSGSIPYCTAYKCKRDLRKVEKGRKCRKKCKRDDQCRGAFKKCECDDWCGRSCFNPGADCPKLSKPSYGYILENGVSYGHTATYGCNQGFTLTGPATRRCRSDRTWSGYPPSCVAFSVCGQSGQVKEARFAGKVIDGTNSNQGAWPWQVLLIHNLDYSVSQIYNTRSGFGGGSIINDEWILSGAHLFNQFPRVKIKKNWKEKFLIVVGMTAYPNHGLAIPEHVNIFEPKDVYIHSSFNKLNFDYDVALIRIGAKLKRGQNNKFIVDAIAPSGKLAYSKFIRPVCLPCMKGDPLKSVDIWRDYDKEKCDPRGKSLLSMLPKAGSFVMVTGFGMKTNHGDLSQYLPSRLQEGLLKIVDQLKCAESAKIIQHHVDYARFTNRMFCASGVNETVRVDSCQGDSGGPIVEMVDLKNNLKSWMQVGIVSWGWECGGAHPGYYTTVSSIMSWVWKILDDNKIGTWKKWGQWSRCSKTCGRGIRVRRRTCATKNCRGVRIRNVVCNAFRCPPVTQCHPIRPPVDGSMKKFPNTKFFGVGSTITFSCNKGHYQSAGPTKIVCKANGKWNVSITPVCKDEWGKWSSWGGCSASCGGARTRARRCLRGNNVLTGVLGCPGNAIAYQKCGESQCPTETQCGGNGNLCLQGDINVDTNRLLSQGTQLLSQLGFFGKRR